jgi:hypothetical protein
MGRRRLYEYATDAERVRLRRERKKAEVIQLKKEVLRLQRKVASLEKRRPQAVNLEPSKSKPVQPAKAEQFHGLITPKSSRREAPLP